MKLTQAIIQAYGELYSVEELKVKLREATEALAKGSIITQATTGSGTGYTRTITMRPQEAIELYQAVLNFKRGLGVSAGQCHVEEFVQLRPIG